MPSCAELADALELIYEDVQTLLRTEGNDCCESLMRIACPHILAASLLLKGTTPEFRAAMGEAV
jgi:hypothetical protein